MLQRRTFVSGLGSAAAFLWTAGPARAQRPAHPIARPPGVRAAGAIVRGRFGPDSGVASGALPGVYVVVAVDSNANTLRLRDEAGRTADVYVSERMMDLDSLKPGDEVEVDFAVPGPGSTRLEAAVIWKLQP
ncbi:hypothetical protein WG902_19140 [Ramlibacter sp. PS3R-8]|uniref:hypothetical protein n=1 Tax=Ramlibacter sp. PS3R-8 TaxID=3133437 RepID=UPI0030AE7E7A